MRRLLSCLLPVVALLALSCDPPVITKPDANFGGAGGAWYVGGGGGSGGAAGSGGSAGSGGDAGSGGSAGTGGSAGSGGAAGTGGAVAIVTNLSDARAVAFGTRVQLAGVVVTAIDYQYVGTQGDSRNAFWVTNPAKTTEGMYIFKDFEDLPKVVTLEVGDVIDIDAFVHTIGSTFDPSGYRYELKGHGLSDGGGIPLVITPKGTKSPAPDNIVPSGFGNAAGGAAQAGKDFAGTRVAIPGPLVLSNPNPQALERSPGGPVYYGFETDTGVLVYNGYTYKSYDGGPSCDFRGAALDGGAVSFPNGIKGIWDTYTHAPCKDGGSSCGSNHVKGYIPGAPDASYTYILYPMDCANDFAGAVIQ